MQKSKSAQKGAGNKPLPGTEQQRSGTHIQKGEGEEIQAPKSGQVKQQPERGKTSKKVGGTGS